MKPTYELVQKAIDRAYPDAKINTHRGIITEQTPLIAQRAINIVNADREQTTLEFLSKPKVISSGQSIDYFIQVIIGELKDGYTLVLDGIVIPSFKRSVGFHSNANGFSKAYGELFKGLWIYRGGKPLIDLENRIGKAASNNWGVFWKKLKRDQSFDNINCAISWDHKYPDGAVKKYSVYPLLKLYTMTDLECTPISEFSTYPTEPNSWRSDRDLKLFLWASAKSIPSSKPDELWFKFEQLFKSTSSIKQTQLKNRLWSVMANDLIVKGDISA
jgi:hypothetical protein